MRVLGAGITKPLRPFAFFPKKDSYTECFIILFFFIPSLTKHTFFNTHIYSLLLTGRSTPCHGLRLVVCQATFHSITRLTATIYLHISMLSLSSILI